jgi:transposase-like protein
MFEASKYYRPKCPFCRRELELDDTTDIEYDEESLVLDETGWCPRCKRDFQWKSSAVLTSWTHTDLQEV